MKFISNDSDESEEETQKDEHTIKMEEGGFIMVAPEDKNLNKGRGTDGVSTVRGISQS